MMLPGFPMPFVMTKGGFDPNTPFGTFVEGGFFAGIIRDNGLLYAILFAPKAQGENASVRWKSSNTAGPIETQTLTNGPAATAAMVAHGNASAYPLAHWAAGLVINGFSDFYIPARDELELGWRNLKPITNNNLIGQRTFSSIIYNRDGNTTDASNDERGLNRHSVPPGPAYTSGNPSRTNASIFHRGNAESFEDAWYWTSTEFATQQAWFHHFNTSNAGIQNADVKTNSIRARAVRRVEIPE